MTLTEARNHIGCKVVHSPGDGKPRHGLITSVGSWKAFVHFGGSGLARAVDPAELELVMAVAR